MFVGIDQSYSGFAMTFLEGNVHETLLQKFEPKKHGTGIERLLAIGQWVSYQLDQVDDITHVCMEGYANGAKFGREQAGELGAIVKRSIYYNAPVAARWPTIVSPAQLKKYVVGKGAAKKNEMLLGVYKKWGADFKDDNEADSYALARLAQAVCEPDFLQYAYERDVVTSLRIHTEKH